MSKHDVGWAAGFFEGEGYIGFCWLKNKQYPHLIYPRLSLSVSQVCREPLDMFCAVVGEGTVRGPYGPYHTTKQAYYQYCAHNAKAEKVIEQLLPYLFHKGEQAKIALEDYRKVLDERKVA